MGSCFILHCCNGATPSLVFYQGYLGPTQGYGSHLLPFPESKTSKTHIDDEKYAYVGHQLHITATNSIYCHHLHNWTGCKSFPDNENIICGMEYGGVLTCTIVGIKQKDTIHHWRHRWIEELLVLDIIYHLLKTLKTQSRFRVGTRAITWTRISYGLYCPNTWTWVVLSQHLDCI